MSNRNSVNTVKILHISLYNTIYKCMYVSLISQQKVAVDAYLPKIMEILHVVIHQHSEGKRLPQIIRKKVVLTYH